MPSDTRAGSRWTGESEPKPIFSPIEPGGGIARSGYAHPMLRLVLWVGFAVMVTTAAVSAQTYIAEYPSGQRLYQYKESYLCNYPSGERLYNWDGEYISRYPSGERLYRFDSGYLTRYPSGQRLYEWDGEYICRYPSGERMFRYDGQYLMRYPSGQRIWQTDGILPVALVTGLATGLL